MRFDDVRPRVVIGLYLSVVCLIVAGFARLDDAPAPPPPFESLSAGAMYNCALTSQRGVMCWGWNGFGQLGQGDRAIRKRPSPVVGLSEGVSAIGSGSVHTCAVMAGGEVKCWGYNAHGALGDGTTAVRRLTPVDVVGLSGPAREVVGGAAHTCALLRSGEVMCWGANASGQLGDGTQVDRHAAVAVRGLRDVIALDAGSAHTCALQRSGAILCWGDNRAGQLGRATTPDVFSSVPGRVAGVSPAVSAITLGAMHSCALSQAGGVACWGSGWRGAIGDGARVNRPHPVQVRGLSRGVRAIASRATHTCALMAGGQVRCWGGNEEGQVDPRGRRDRLTPVIVPGLPHDLSALSVGHFHSCGLRRSGEVACWGDVFWDQ